MAVFSGNGSATAPSFTFSSDTNLGIYRGGTDIISFTTAGSERANIDASGTLNIGGTNIQLNADGSSEFVGSVVTDAFFRAGDNPATGGAVGAAVDDNGKIQLSVAAGTQTALAVYTQGTSTETANILGNGSAYFADTMGIGGTSASPNIELNANGSASFAGSVSKASGSFRIPHPLPELNETHHLVHSFIEGPQADNIYRGQVTLEDGVALVDLDVAARMTEGTFVLLNTNISCFTSNETDWTPVRGSVSGSTLTIEAQDNTSTATVSWMVVGERHDQHMLDTEWTDENGRVITEPLKPVVEESEED